MLMTAPEDSIVTREALASYPTPRATRSWQPIPFADFVDTAQDVSESLGLMWGEEQHVVCRNDTQLFSLVEIQQENSPSDGRAVLCTRTSLNKTLAPGGCFGKSLSICTNLDLWGEENFSRRQTTFVTRDLRQVMTSFLAKFSATQEYRESLQERYASAFLTDSMANHVLIRLVQSDVVSTRRLNEVIKEYYSPSHEEHLTQGMRTAWTLFNAVTEAALKNTAMDTMATRTTKLHEFIGKISDYSLDKRAQPVN